MYKKHFLSFCALFFTFCHNGIVNTLKINRLIKKLNCIFFYFDTTIFLANFAKVTISGIHSRRTSLQRNDYNIPASGESLQGFWG